MNKKAFTLIEVTISAAIFLTLLTGVIVVGAAGNRIYLVITNSIDVRQQARNAMDRIVREVRESSATTVTPDLVLSKADQISFMGPRYKDSAGNFQPVRYFLSEGRIIREFPPSVMKIVATDIVSLRFQQAGAQIEVGIEASRIVNNVSLNFIIKQKVRARNE